MARSKSKRSGNYWQVPASQVREFELQIAHSGGIDYAALCLDCLPPAEKASAYKKLESQGKTTKQVSKHWRESSWKK